ncbi:MAG: alanine--tRNA ligase [Acidobacteria bacterium]|nr:MAG: alanine--tRNA ligase [Acidobacteriota bacterium]
MKSEQIREAFLKYFEEHGHSRVTSSSLIPANDPTLLFANAGMNQFKDVFLGYEKRDYTTACSSQKCVRAGGKHNDLENVGFTARHHTFFEMLGNFSFGDYFKEEAIRYGWEFLTEILQIPSNRLYASVFLDDDEAYDIWHKQIGLPESRIFRFDEKENFWSMGDTGPCGPCSEIYYDYGPSVKGSDDPYQGILEGSDRYVEVWNLVFMQYDRDDTGKMTPLPNPSIDTGMGLERVTSVIQGVTSNYHTDLFQDIITPLSKYLKVESSNNPKTAVALQVIADHLRATCFLIADGVIPSNEGRGYVLRRIMRRAMKFGKQLGQTGPFLYETCAYIIEKMGDIYPELKKEAKQIQTLVQAEELQFDQTLQNGMPILMKYMDKLRSDNQRVLPGQVLHFMYTTHGFPVDLMEDIARDEGFTVNLDEFTELMEEDAKKSAMEGDFNKEDLPEPLIAFAADNKTVQNCYGSLKMSSKIQFLLLGDTCTNCIENGQEAAIALDQTPFYAESGGQIGDSGTISTESGVFQVERTEKVLNNSVLHYGKMRSGTIRLNQKAECEVSELLRNDIRRNHTATHLMHQALKDVLGLHVRQAGSLVDAEKLRFDFNHFSPVMPEEQAEIERRVNEQIRKNTPLVTQLMDLEEARKEGAVALFGEKYSEQVRVVSIGDYSMELCGGTHVSATGEIGLFKIVSERALASGIRRMVALTGKQAFDYIQDSEKIIGQSEELLHVKRERVTDQIEKILKQRKELEKEIEELKFKIAKGEGQSEQITDVKQIKVLTKVVTGMEAGALRSLADDMLVKISRGVVVLGSNLEDKAQVVVKTNCDQEGIHAGNIIKELAPMIGGRGGGRPQMAMAGGKDPSKLQDAINFALEKVKEIMH